MKKKKQGNSGIPPLKKNGKLINTNTEKANILNDQFKSVFTIDTNESTITKCNTTPEDIGSITVTE